MRYFPLLDFQHWVLAVALGVIVAIAVYIAWQGYPRDRDPDVDPDHDASPDVIPESQHYPIAPLLVLIYAGTVLWALGYMLMIGVFGGAIF